MVKAPALEEGIDILIHTAALKQVPATEYNPFETVKTNVIGTQNLIEVAIKIISFLFFFSI